MKTPVYDSRIVLSNDLPRYSQNVVDDFLKKAIVYPPLIINLSFYSTKAAYKAGPKRSFAGPIYSEKQNDRFIIHLCEESLNEVPSLALQGWLEHELALCMQKLQPEFYQINFKRNISPLLPVSGLAENHMLELVEHLESGLKKYLATRLLIDMGHGLPQVYCYFFKLNFSIEDADNYQETISHHWTRALFVCRKLKEFMSISLLAGQNIEFAQELETFWWNSHDYLLPEDKTMFKEIVRIPDQHYKDPYLDNVIEIFKIVKFHLLAPQKGSVPSSVMH